MLYSLFRVYVTSTVIGSPDKMWELLKEAAQLNPVAGNADGEYLTMKSEGGGYIGLVFIGAGFAAAVDSQLFQKAIAADPRSTSRGYIIGGLSWFTIPFVLASTYGLTAAATEHLSVFPTYPNRMNPYEVSSGMAMPYAALAVNGKGGVIAILLMIFMAVTSAMSSETVATTALLTYNVYQAYINPKATGKQLLAFSHCVTIGFAIVSAAIAVAFNHGGFSVSFLITAIGIFVDSAIIPMACTLMWKKQSKLAVIASPLASSAAAILAWFLTAHTHVGEISISSLSQNLPLVAGNMMALTGPIVLTPLLTYLKPENFDWQKFKDEIKRGDDEHITIDGVALTTHNPEAEAVLSEREKHEEENSKILMTARNRSIVMSIILTLALTILWPIPMYATDYIFSKPFFRAWVAVLFISAFLAAGSITLLPIWDSRHVIVILTRRWLGKKDEHLSEAMSDAVTVKEVQIEPGKEKIASDVSERRDGKVM